MLIESAVKMIQSVPDGWVRAEQIRRIRGGLELSFGVYGSRRGKQTEAWSVMCLGVRETKITDLDGGGFAVYASTYPAARQYVARQAELRWSRSSDQTAVLAALHQAHIETVDDWIPFDRYLLMYGLYTGGPFERTFASGNQFVCRGPEFLIRAYATALRVKGERVQVSLRRTGKPKSGRPKVLHFGSSYVIADEFSAQRQRAKAAPRYTSQQ
jgi:hypothetical protein